MTISALAAPRGANRDLLPVRKSIRIWTIKISRAPSWECRRNLRKEFETMRRLIAIVFILSVGALGSGVITGQNNMKAPVAKKIPKTLKIHGYEITDNYAWLRDRNDQKDPAIIQYLTDNN